MAYSKTTWVNGSAPALSAENLNKIEQGIYDCDASTTTNATDIATLQDSTMYSVSSDTATVTVSSGSYKSGTIDVTLAGYYPIGIVGFGVANGSGSGGTFGVPWKMILTARANGSCTIGWGLRAVDGNVNSCTLTVEVLWRKVL